MNLDVDMDIDAVMDIDVDVKVDIDTDMDSVIETDTGTDTDMVVPIIKLNEVFFFYRYATSYLLSQLVTTLLYENRK
jgi:hypothetical protein